VHAGTEFEKRILSNEKQNQKFSFLLPTDPYHAYYQLKVALLACFCAVPDEWLMRKHCTANVLCAVWVPKDQRGEGGGQQARGLR
jgi:hypothetical protein